jgi:septal ring factor EnvC (AmiA/AmiB activator)
MPLSFAMTLNILIVASLAVLALAVLLHVRQTRRKLDAIDFEEMKRRLSDLGQKVEEAERALETSRKETAELKIKGKAIENDLSEIQEEMRRFLGIFKTVLYGFDYIVQGCKNALEIGPAEKQPAEKQILSE